MANRCKQSEKDVYLPIYSSYEAQQPWSLVTGFTPRLRQAGLWVAHSKLVRSTSGVSGLYEAKTHDRHVVDRSMAYDEDCNKLSRKINPSDSTTLNCIILLKAQI